MSPTSFRHVGLTVSDLDRFLLFWRDGLGLEVACSQEIEGGYVAVVTGETEAHVRQAHLRFPNEEAANVELLQYLSLSGGR
jgi:catechol 2,3-dioxygenase-like lactoylglutathione lyase family enzyme